ncbi:hypothetical protein LHYA1_G002817 [Lachnellula hyalina]|uniref:Uncharacterized protein n=1 Tax=Lachnellula hyalina TaxID=1316788 RepID=A0A8H8R4I0_9HELO|nr:uncharacterized protein LHYA1_G002817 [Lachnellula hyalina]TVY28442.1 hypothetical protein LHYA1_G002817 [Lachnellula hyalina]
MAGTWARSNAYRTEKSYAKILPWLDNIEPCGASETMILCRLIRQYSNKPFADLLPYPPKIEDIHIRQERQLFRDFRGVKRSFSWFGNLSDAKECFARRKRKCVCTARSRKCLATRDGTIRGPICVKGRVRIDKVLNDCVPKDDVEGVAVLRGTNEKQS